MAAAFLYLCVFVAISIVNFSFRNDYSIRSDLNTIFFNGGLQFNRELRLIKHSNSKAPNRPICSWSKRGHKCIYLPILQDLSIFMDVERNPGPDYYQLHKLTIHVLHGSRLDHDNLRQQYNNFGNRHVYNLYSWPISTSLHYNYHCDCRFRSDLSSTVPQVKNRPRSRGKRAGRKLRDRIKKIQTIIGNRSIAKSSRNLHNSKNIKQRSCLIEVSISNSLYNHNRSQSTSDASGNNEYNQLLNSATINCESSNNKVLDNAELVNNKVLDPLIRSRKQLKVFHLNTQSLKMREHFHEVSDYILENDYDIVTISETWFNTSVTNASVAIQGYKLHRLDRLRKSCGGVCAYIRNHLKAEKIKDLTSITESGFHQLWLKIQHKQLRTFIVCVAYRPPDSSILCFDTDLMATYTQALSFDKEIILLGDLNCDLMTDNPKAAALHSFCESVNSTQLIKDPTRVTRTSSTLVDVITVSNPDLVKKSGVVHLSISDHFAVYAVLDLKAPKWVPVPITTRSFKRYDPDLFCEEISEISWDTINTKESIDEKLDTFNELFTDVLNRHAPIKTFKLKHKPSPFMTPELKQSIEMRNKAHKKARQSNSVEDWESFNTLKRAVKRGFRQSERDYYNTEIKSNKENRGSIWKTIRRAMPTKSNDHLQYTKDTSVLANEFNEFFTTVGQRAAAASKQLAEKHNLDLSADFACPSPPTNSHDQFCFKPVSSEYVKSVIMSMPSNKSPGYDKVSIKVIRDCLPYILDTITNIVNCSFQSSTFPLSWKKAEVVPLLKDGDHECANNNRPISLLPVLSKVAERIAHTQLSDYLDSNGKFSIHQSGNRKLYSTETLGLLVTDYIYKAIDEKKVTAMVLIDLSKAFDSISHTILLKKLKSLGVSNPAISWFMSYLTDRQQCTRIGISTSDPLPVNYGVPQGSILGPLLFTIYMSDLPHVSNHCELESFVDDTKLFLAFSTMDADDALSQISLDLNRTAAWCCRNQLLINPDKTKFILFGVPQLTSLVKHTSINFLGNTIPQSFWCRDLGTILDSHLTFNNHINTLYSSLLSTLCQINRVKHLFDTKTLQIILNSLVFSKLYYCSTIWAGTSKQNIEKLQLLQNFAARIMTDKRKYDHISSTICRLGWMRVENHLKYRDMVQIFKCKNQLAPTYLSSKLTTRSQVHKYQTRQHKDLNVARCRTTLAQRSFFTRATKTWNSLPNTVKSCITLRVFKSSLRKTLI